MIKVIYEDDHILVCDKKEGIPTQAGKVTEKDMVSEVNNYMRKAGAKASAYLIHRLDKPVRGLLVFAKTKQAAAELNRQISSGEFEKRYYALVEGVPDRLEDTLIDYMYKDGSLNKSVIADIDKNASMSKRCDIKQAELRYKVVFDGNNSSVDKSGFMRYEDLPFDGYLSDEDINKVAVLDIKLVTGRFHQIRCQLSNSSHPIVGDTLYGADILCKKRKAIGLISYSLSFKHPETKKKMHFLIEK